MAYDGAAIPTYRHTNCSSKVDWLFDLFRERAEDERGRSFAMVSYAIIELDDGLSVVTVDPGESPENAAAKERGLLVDPGPYATYEDAYDAITNLEEDEDRRD